MQLDVPVTHIKELVKFCKKYQETGVTSARDVEPKFREKYVK
jgi:hypothetical protein